MLPTAKRPRAANTCSAARCSSTRPASILAEKPQVAAFVNYYLTNATEVVAEVGYFPVSTEALNASKQAWLDAMAESAGS